jgi:transcription-repair coupling factor (superfamily II helicase)
VQLPESREVRVHRLYPKTVLKPTVRTMLVPTPKVAAGGSAASGRQAPAVSLGAQPLRDQELLTWCCELVETIFGGLQPSAAEE